MKYTLKFNNMNSLKIGLVALGFITMNQSIAQESKDQTAQNSDKMFLRMDANGDGVIDKAEFTAAKEKREEKTGKEIDSEKQFAKFDTNSDGHISKSEYDTRKAEMKARREANDKNRPDKSTK